MTRSQLRQMAPQKNRLNALARYFKVTECDSSGIRFDKNCPEVTSLFLAIFVPVSMWQKTLRFPPSSFLFVFCCCCFLGEGRGGGESLFSRATLRVQI